MVVLNNYVDEKGKTALIACEESQEICKALRQKGVYAFSCDIIDPSGGHPEWHIKGDCLPYINGNCEFATMNGQHYQLNGPWDLLIAHPPCFMAGTKIMTYDGIKNIEDIKVGDMVLTHQGRYKKVYNIMQHQANNVVDVQVENSGHIFCTDNHPFYTQEVIRIGAHRVLNEQFKWVAPQDFITEYNSTGIKRKTLISSICDNIYENIEWQGIEKGKNAFATEIVNTLPIQDENFWYIIGRWVGDGTIYRKTENGKKKLRGITICCNKNETEELQNRINQAGFNSHPTTKETVNLFYIYGKELATFCLQFGEHADGKYIPGFVNRLSENLAKSFLNGYFDADGCKSIPNKISYCSVSSNLTYGIKYLINKYLKRPCSITFNNNSNRNIIQGRACNVKNSYAGNFYIERTKQEHSIKYQNYILSPYRSITPIQGEYTVYNLSVEEDESYTANGIIVHNCTYLTVSGNRWYNVERYGDSARERLAKREEAIAFFMKFINADCPHIAVENPIGIMSTLYRKPNQIIQPYWFGHPVSKSTCLWLKNLPNLVPTDMVEPERIHSKGKTGGYSGNSWYVKDENGKILSWNDPRTAEARSKTFPGIAKAIAEQWSDKI